MKEKSQVKIDATNYGQIRTHQKIKKNKTNKKKPEKKYQST